ncbi:hypothetical protein [Parasphingorhabdus litoris]|nr:hypothetical protein [Parasphingorhabdus litoris]
MMSFELAGPAFLREFGPDAGPKPDLDRQYSVTFGFGTCRLLAGAG